MLRSLKQGASRRAWPASTLYPAFSVGGILLCGRPRWEANTPTTTNQDLPRAAVSHTKAIANLNDSRHWTPPLWLEYKRAVVDVSTRTAGGFVCTRARESGKGRPLPAAPFFVL